ncbi:unnamed protein product, partial [Symbiodinium microadriaticum]
RMMQHIMQMVMDCRRNSSDPIKWVLLVIHLVVSRNIHVPLHCSGQAGFSVALLDELEPPVPWEETVLTHTDGNWSTILGSLWIVSLGLLLDIVRKNVWRLAVVPLRTQTADSHELIQANRLDLLALVDQNSFQEELIYYSDHSCRGLQNVPDLAEGWQAKLSHSAIARAGSFRKAKIRQLEATLAKVIERFCQW